MFGILKNDNAPLPVRLGYTLSNVSGTQCQCPENITEVDGPQKFASPNPGIGINPYPYVPDDKRLSQKDFAMRNAGAYFRNLEVTPDQFESAKIDYNYPRRYTVLPTPKIGLFAFEPPTEDN